MPPPVGESGGVSVKRFYNQRQDLRHRKRRFSHEFWEMPVRHDVLCGFSEEHSLWHETEEDAASRRLLRESVAEIMPLIAEVMDEVLTDRQRDIVRLYFMEQRTQQEIAELLEISVPSVSQHLFGKRRAGKVIGGAIPKIRKRLLQSDITIQILSRLEKRL